MSDFTPGQRVTDFQGNKGFYFRAPFDGSARHHIKWDFGGHITSYLEDEFGPVENVPVVPIKFDPIMLCLVGSRMYGLDHADSDYDWKGVHLTPSRTILGLAPPAKPYTTKAPLPDFSMYELRHFVELLLKCNPTVVEMLFANEYELLSPAGRLLVENRSEFLFSRSEIVNGKEQSFGVESAYYGFAHGQRKDILNGKATEKHVVHLFRVLWQGEDLLATGKCDPRLSREQVDYARFIAAQDVDDIIHRVDMAMKSFKVVASNSVLPRHSDWDGIDRMVMRIRRSFGGPI